jgi:hypothetical protein
MVKRRIAFVQDAEESDYGEFLVGFVRGATPNSPVHTLGCGNIDPLEDTDQRLQGVVVEKIGDTEQGFVGESLDGRQFF